MKCAKIIEEANKRRIEPTLIFDIGSFDCGQAVELSEAFPLAKVLALEADPYNIPKCLATLSAHPQAHVQIVNAALTQQTGLVTFSRAIGQNDQCGSLLRPNDCYPQAMPVEQIMVAGLSARDLIFRLGVPQIVWMDVQGTELDFFDGHEFRPQLIWLEVAYQAYYHGQPLEAEVVDRLSALGYDPIFEAPGIAAWFGDILFARR